MSTKQDHKRWRKEFNEDCLSRDGHKCVFCNEIENLDVHHITDRHDMPNGGYGCLNGITLCEDHHLLCEEYHISGFCEEKYHPSSLYIKINTTFDDAFKQCENLK
jgi:hypothetical protein